MGAALMVVLFLACFGSCRTATAQTQTHRFRFFLDPALAQNLTDAELKRRLSLYVEDLNTIFSRQTNRRFNFNPDTDIAFSLAEPHSRHITPPYPEQGYEVWAHARKSQNTLYGSYGGYGSVDDSGAGVAAGLYWDAVHDRDYIATLPAGAPELRQYWTQLDHLVHEIEHVFGAGLGEYYSMNFVDDLTGVAPRQDIRSDWSAPQNDPFWAAHPDFWFDPLTRMLTEGTYAQRMAQVRFADVTVVAIEEGARATSEKIARTLPQLNQTMIWVRDAQSQAAVPGARVRIWKVNALTPYNHTALFDGNTDASGSVEINWTGKFSSSDMALLIKVYYGDKTVVKWFFIYDAVRQRMLEGNDNVDITIPLAANVTAPTNTPPTLSQIVPLDAAGEDQPFVISYDALATAADEADAETPQSTLLFRVESVTSGALTKNGGAALPGTTVLRPGENLTWTPPLNDNGDALPAFTVRAFDGQENSATAVPVAINVAAVNDLPTLYVHPYLSVTEDIATIHHVTNITSGVANENQTLTISASAADPALISSVSVNYTSPQNTAIINVVPAQNASGTTTLTVTVSDGQASVSRSVSATIYARNDAPTITPPPTLTLDEDGPPQTIAFTGVTSGAANEDQALTVTAFTYLTALVEPTVTYTSPQTSGTVTFSLAPNKSGSGPIYLRVSDGQTTTEKYFYVYVRSVNDAPTLTTFNDLTGATEETPFTISHTMLAAAGDEADIESNNLRFRIESVESGTLTFGGRAVGAGFEFYSNYSVTWTPPVNASGTVTAFTATAWDGLLASAHPIPVRVVVANSSDGPVAQNQSARTDEDVMVDITLSASDPDGDALTYNAVALPQHGTLTGSAPDLWYTPHPNYHGPDSFSYRVSDGALHSNVATVSITVTPQPDAPSLTSVTPLAGAKEDGLYTVTHAALLAASNATDVDGGSLAFRVEGTLSGTLTKNGQAIIPGTLLSAGESLGWTPAANVNGTVPAFGVKAWDGQAASSSTVAVNVNLAAVNDAPSFTMPVTSLIVAKNSRTETRTGCATNISAGPTDESGQTVTFVVTSNNTALFSTQPAVSPSGTLTFTPAKNKTGTATLSIKLQDNGGTANGGVNTSVTQTFTIRIG